VTRPTAPTTEGGEVLSVVLMGKIYESTGTIPEPKAGLEIGRGAATRDPRSRCPFLGGCSCGTGGSGCGGCSPAVWDGVFGLPLNFVSSALMGLAASAQSNPQGRGRERATR